MKYSVVIPVYQCAKCLKDLNEAIIQTFSNLTDEIEIIYVDDRSRDDSWQAISEMANADSRVKGVRLSRNFGQHIAITAGLNASSGDRVAVMDCDLQDPPSELPKLISMLDQGYDFAVGLRKVRKHSIFRQLLASSYARLMTWLTQVTIKPAHGTFSLLSRKVVDSFLLFNDRDRHYLYILFCLGYRFAEVEYQHTERRTGRSSYTFSKLVAHAMSGMFFHETRILSYILSLGIAFGFLSFILGAYFIYAYFVNRALSGWTSLSVLILFCSGAILISIGICGMYINRIFEQTKGRPLYLIDQKMNFKKSAVDINDLRARSG